MSISCQVDLEKISAWKNFIVEKDLTLISCTDCSKPQNPGKLKHQEESKSFDISSEVNFGENFCYAKCLSEESFFTDHLRGFSLQNLDLKRLGKEFKFKIEKITIEESSS